VGICASVPDENLTGRLLLKDDRLYLAGADMKNVACACYQRAPVVLLFSGCVNG